jgi:hypothetical protein
MGKIMDYTYSYSGADCRAYAFFPDNPGSMVDLSSLATISISVHEAKSPVRRLGERGVSGYTRGIRTIAGSMVFLVIEDHPLWKLIHANNNYSPGYSSTDWNRDSDRSISRINQRKLSTMIRPFNIMLVYQTEVVKTGNSSKVSLMEIPEKASLIIENIDILNEGLVTSVNDMVTEVQMQFVAQDYYSLDKGIQELKQQEIIENTLTMQPKQPDIEKPDPVTEIQNKLSFFGYKGINELNIPNLSEEQKTKLRETNTSIQLKELAELIREVNKDAKYSYDDTMYWSSQYGQLTEIQKIINENKAIRDSYEVINGKLVIKNKE